MTTEQFRKYWNHNYPNSYPIGHELKGTFNDRWFRIHSLPRSKRYPEDIEESKILLGRQNDIISELFGDHSDFLILLSLYSTDLSNENYKDLDYAKKYMKVDSLNLHDILPEKYEDEAFCDIYIKKEKWEQNAFNDILRKIADDKIRAIFINQKAKCLLIPYDGGMDIILKDTKTKEFYKKKYSNWISEREDEL